MHELPKDPKVIRAANRRLVPGETVLWASAQRGLGRRGLTVVAATLFAWLATWIAMAWGRPMGIVVLLAIFSPFLLWWLAEMMARSFLATDRRIIFVSRMWPYRWSYWNYADMDVPLVKVGKGKNVIHLRHFVMRASGEPSWQSRGAVYPTYIEKVPDIEAVRELILEQIRVGEPPVREPEPKPKSRRRFPPVHGTRTG